MKKQENVQEKRKEENVNLKNKLRFNLEEIKNNTKNIFNKFNKNKEEVKEEDKSLKDKEDIKEDNKEEDKKPNINKNKNVKKKVKKDNTVSTDKVIKKGTEVTLPDGSKVVVDSDVFIKNNKEKDLQNKIKDIEFLEKGIHNKDDYIIVSFITTGEDVNREDIISVNMLKVCEKRITEAYSKVYKTHGVSNLVFKEIGITQDLSNNSIFIEDDLNNIQDFVKDFALVFTDWISQNFYISLYDKDVHEKNKMVNLEEIASNVIEGSELGFTFKELIDLYNVNMVKNKPFDDYNKTFEGYLIYEILLSIIASPKKGTTLENEEQIKKRSIRRMERKKRNRRIK